MQQGYPHIETLAEAVDGLRSQVDFRYQHQHLTALFEYLFDQIQINFRLAASANASEQEYLMVMQCTANCVDRQLLFGIQAQCWLCQQGAARAGAFQTALFREQQALVHQGVNAGFLDTKIVQLFVSQPLTVLQYRFQCLTLARSILDTRIFNRCTGSSLIEALFLCRGRLALA